MWHFSQINTYTCACVCVCGMYIESSWAASFIANVCNECKLVKSFHVARDFRMCAKEAQLKQPAATKDLPQ